MFALCVAILLALVPAPAAQDASDAQKKEFIEVLKTLPTKGEFYTEEAVRTAAPFLPALLSLTEKDIEKYDIYPFAAISRGLANNKQHRAYAVAHFAGIRHPGLKLFWAAMLFDSGDASREIVRYLRDALDEPEQAGLLAQMVGPDFKFFKRKVGSHPYASEGRAKAAQQPEEDVGHADWVVAVAFSPDGKALVSGSHDGTLILWDVATGKQLRSIEGHRERGRPFEVVSVTFSPDGKVLASVSSDQTVRLWNVATGVQLRVFTGVKYAQDVKFSPDGKRLVAANCETVLLWDVAAGALSRSFRKAPTGVGGSYCASHAAFSPDGRTLIADGGPIQIWDVSTGAEVRRFEPQGSGFAMALSADGRRLLLGEDFKGYLGMIELWDVESGKLLRRFPQQPSPVECVALAPDGNTAASESRDGSDIESDGVVKLWDLTTGAELRTLAGHKRRVAAIAFAPDGRTLATGSWDHTVRLWDVTTGKEVRSFPSGH
jgi:DNA-binding beta-propeller fold protein YncE